MGIKFDEVNFDLDAGRLCLDFANTADWHASAEPTERLNSYNDLVLWGWATNLLGEDEALALWTTAGEHPEIADKVYERAIELREVLYRVFSQTVMQESLAREDLDFLNAALREAMMHLQLNNAADRFSLQWEISEKALDRMLWPVVRSAVDLLTSDDLGRVGECADDRGCGYLFYDTSRNRSRRWCSMESCGNRAKAMRHYERYQED